jgi:hypothetical protein
MRPEIVVTDVNAGTKNVVREMTEEEHEAYLEGIKNAFTLPTADNSDA